MMKINPQAGFQAKVVKSKLYQSPEKILSRAANKHE